MIVDTHAHYLPQKMLDAFKARAAEFPSIECLNEDKAWKLGFAGGPLTRPIMPKLRDAEQRLKWMDDNGIDVQVAGGWLDSFGYEIPDAEGEKWSRFINEQLMKATEGESRIAPLASVPLQNGKRAAKVLEDALAAGFHGAMIGTQPKGGSGNLDDPDLDPFWEAASSLGATIYLHPMFGCGDPRLADFDLINTVGRGADTMTAVARLVFAGHLRKYTGMTFVLSHGGGGLPYLLGRMRCNHANHPDYGDPQASLDACYYDTVVHDAATLEFLCRSFGADRVMMGSDYPFPIGDMEPLRIIRESGLSEAEKTDILGTVAGRVFHLDGCGC